MRRTKLYGLLALLIILTLLIVPVGEVKAAGDPWYNASWGYRLEITIDHTKVDANLTDFPVLITEDNITATFWAEVLATGADIVVTDNNGETKLNRELVSIDTVGETMELWFKAPTLDKDVDGVFYLYFGNAGATETNDTDTWNTNYVGVWHMDDDPDNAHIQDSTGYGNDGDKKAANEPNEVAGTIGMAQDFDGANDYINCGNNASLDYVNGMTFQARIKTPDAATYREIFSKGTAYNNNLSPYQLKLHNDGRVACAVGNGATYQQKFSNTQVDDNAWHTVTATLLNLNVAFFLDGSPDGTGTFTITPVNNAADMLIGMLFTGYPFADLIDEARVSATDQSAGWIGTAHNTMADPANFYSVAGETAPSTDFLLVAVGNNQVDITWTKGAGADKTMVRRSLDGYPVNRTDGFQIYYDTGTSTSDVSVDLDNKTYYYRAWSETLASDWSDPVGDQIGGTVILLILFGFIGLGFTVAFFWKQAGFLGYGAAGMWALLGFTSIQSSASDSPIEITDTYMALFWLCFALVIGCALLPTVMRGKKEAGDITTEGIDNNGQGKDSEEDLEMLAEEKRMDSDRSRFNRLLGHRKPKRKLSRYDRTGEH